MPRSDWIDFLIYIGSALLALTIIAKTAVSVYHGFKIMHQRVEAVDDLLKKELKPNHGTSIKDQMNEIASFMRESQTDRMQLNKLVVLAALEREEIKKMLENHVIQYHEGESG